MFRKHVKSVCGDSAKVRFRKLSDGEKQKLKGNQGKNRKGAIYFGTVTIDKAAKRRFMAKFVTRVSLRKVVDDILTSKIKEHASQLSM